MICRILGRCPFVTIFLDSRSAASLASNCSIKTRSDITEVDLNIMPDEPFKDRSDTVSSFISETLTISSKGIVSTKVSARAM
jgi:hypothetical protein